MSINPIKENLKNINLFRGDCLEVMDELIAKGVTVDAIITDIPFQTTACEWDSLIPFNNFLMLPKSRRSKKLHPVYKDEYILQEMKKIGTIKKSVIILIKIVKTACGKN